MSSLPAHSARSASDRYTSVSIAFHWTAAVLVIGLYVMGLSLESFGEAFKRAAIPLHKSLGVLLLGLTALRLAWRLATPQPTALDGPAWQHHAATAAHWLLYALMIAIPVSGIVMSWSAGRPVSVFGLVELPTLMAKNDSARDVKEIHEILSNVLMIVVGLHAAAAIWHHRVLKDATLTRMLPQLRRG